MQELKRVRVRLEEVPPLFEGKTINDPQDAVEMMMEYLSTSDREMVFMLNMSVKGQVLNMEIASIGSLTQAEVVPRELLKSAILSNAASIIMIHNHPSGDPTPSSMDLAITDKMNAATELLGIKLLDHIIAGEKGTCYSFRKAGILEEVEDQKKIAERMKR